MTTQLSEQLDELGISYGYFWNRTLNQEPEEDRLNREAFTIQISQLFEKEKQECLKAHGIIVISDEAMEKVRKLRAGIEDRS